MPRGISAINAIWRERQEAALRAQEAMPHRAYPRHGYDPNQPRVPKGDPHGGEWTDTGRGENDTHRVSSQSGQVLSDALPELPRVWSQYAQAGIGHNSQDPAVERTRETLHKILHEVNTEVARATRGDPVSARLYGVLVHAAFARVVRDLDLPGIGKKGVEQSFNLEGLVRYGLDGSIRTDVVLRNKLRHIIAIFDVKTGNAAMSPARETKIREFTRVGNDVPVIILHAVRGAGLW